MKHRFRKPILIAGITAAVLLISSTAISYLKFQTPNPFMTGYGFARVFLTDSSYIRINSSPDVFLAKPDNAEENLLQMMREQGYTYAADKRMGSLLTFEKNGEVKLLFFSTNRYYSKWISQKAQK